MTGVAAVALRRAGPADAERLAAFAARTFRETFGPDNRPEDMEAHEATAYGVDRQTRELEHPGWITLLAEHDGELAAYAQVRRSDPPPCISTDGPVELFRFYVDRPWQGSGLAGRLMEAVCGAARELGGRTLWLGVWERNPRAIAFYRKSGYRDVGTTVYHVGTDPQTDRVMLVELEG